MSKLLLFGGSGQLGTAIQGLADARWHIDSPSSVVANLSNVDELARLIAQSEPNIVVNGAAYTSVDEAESEPELAFQINAVAPAAIAAATHKIDALFIHVSTDYLFDGMGNIPYETSAPTNPLNAYGASKLAGELAVARQNPAAIVVRTSWVHSGGGRNFVATAVRILGSGQSMHVVDDQVGAPTSASNLARAVLLFAEQRDASGLFHFTDSGVASWYDVACCVLDTMREMGQVRDDVSVVPINSSLFPQAAKRPKVTLLDTHTTRDRIKWTPPHWRVGVVASTKALLGRLARSSEK